MRPLTLLLSALLAVTLLAGCGSGDEDGSGTATTGGAATGGTGANAPATQPGLYDLPDDRTQAVGVLAHRDLEGGFWAVVRATEGEPADEAQVVAVLANAETLDVDLEALEGSYVRAEGRLLEGASIRMAGPELEADVLEPFAGGAPTQEDQGGRSGY